MRGRWQSLRRRFGPRGWNVDGSADWNVLLWAKRYHMANALKTMSAAGDPATMPRWNGPGGRDTG